MYLSILLVLSSALSLWSQEKQLIAATSKPADALGQYYAYYDNLKFADRYKVDEWAANNGYVIKTDTEIKTRFGGNKVRYIKQVTLMDKDDYQYGKAVKEGTFNSLSNYITTCNKCNHKNEVEGKLLEKLTTLNRCKVAVRDHGNLEGQIMTKATQIGFEGDIDTWRKFVELFPDNIAAAGFNGMIAEYEEQERVRLEQKLMLAKEQQRKEEEQQRVEEERIYKAQIKAAEERILLLEKATIGDKICYTQDWTKKENYLFFFQDVSNYKMYVTCFIERIVGSASEGNLKFQIRIGQVTSSDNYNYSYPELDGVKVSKGDIVWIKPLGDPSWYLCY